LSNTTVFDGRDMYSIVNYINLGIT